MLESLGSNNAYGSGEAGIGSESGSTINVKIFIDLFKRRFFWFLIPFGLVSTFGLYLAAIQTPSYLSEGKLLMEVQTIAPEIVRPVVTATSSERIQLIEQRVTTRDTLLSIANKFDLFPELPQATVIDLMRKSLEIKPVEVAAGQGRSVSTVALMIGFEYESPEIAMRVANEFVSRIVGEDARSRTTPATEAVKILTDEAKGIENKLESTQMQMLEIARRTRDTLPEVPEEQKSELATLSALKAELVQKMAVYSDAHPAVIALKKRIAAMEKNITHPSQLQTQSQSSKEEMEALKRQREALETRLADVNGKLANARLGENQEQEFERLQVIEAPALPQKPKSKRLKTVGMSFIAAIVFGIGAIIGRERLDGSIRGLHEVTEIVPRNLVVCIPHIATRTDIIRTRARILLAVVGVVLTLTAWGGLVTAVWLKLPVDIFSLTKAAAVALHTSADHS